MSATQETTPTPRRGPFETQRGDRSSLAMLEVLRTENDQLRMALLTRIVIEQAKGMVAERLDLEVGEAFERLRREARNRRMKLHALAAAVVAREHWIDAIFARREPGGPAHAPAVHTAAAAPAATSRASAQTAQTLDRS